MMVLLDEMELLENVVIVVNLALQAYQVLQEVQELQVLLALQEMQDKEVKLVLEVRWVPQDVQEKEVCLVPKDLVVTKVTTEIEVIGARKDTGVSLDFKAFLALLVQLVSKAVLAFQAHLVLGVLQVQLVLLEKMEVLVHLGQLGLLVLEGL